MRFLLPTRFVIDLGNDGNIYLFILSHVNVRLSTKSSNIPLILSNLIFFNRCITGEFTFPFFIIEPSDVLNSK